MKKILFASAVSILLTACGSGAGSDSDSSSIQNQESSISNGIDGSGNSTTDNPDSGNDPDNVANPEPAPSPEPGAEPVAMYSYTNDVSTALPLNGATLEQRVVYIFWQGVDANSVTYYCCKGLSGEASGESHSSPVTVGSAPYTMTIDLSGFSTSGSRELYVDYEDASGTFIQGNYTQFAIDTESGGGTPAPAPTPPPSYTVDARLEWIAPTEREDGSSIGDGDIINYGITYTDPYGNTRTEVISGSQTNWSTTLSAGAYEFAIYATDSSGARSQLSETISCNISDGDSYCI